MKILLTNDDGIFSPGIRIIEEILSKDHEIMVVAPDSERSGFSNSLTFHRKLIIEKLDKNHYTCDGTPADCVHRTLLGAVPFEPDIIVSGINIGPNLGTDLIYSGTAAAARQSALMGIPGVAVSVSSFTEPFYFETAAEFMAVYIEYFRDTWGSDCFFNINVPSIPPGNHEIAVTKPARRMYHDSILKKEISGSNRIEISLGMSSIDHHEDEQSDCDAVLSGKISVSPIYLHPVPDLNSGLYSGSGFGEK